MPRKRRSRVDIYHHRSRGCCGCGFLLSLLALVGSAAFASRAFLHARRTYPGCKN